MARGARVYGDGTLMSGTARGARVYAGGVLQGDNFVSLTTTKSGLCTLEFLGTVGAIIYIDWGEGGALEEFVMTGGIDDCENTYGDASSKDIKIYGDLNDITFCRSNGMDLTSADVSNFPNLTYLAFAVNAALEMDISTLSGMTSLGQLYLQSTLTYGDVAVLSTLSSLGNTRLYSTNLTGSIASWSALTTVTQLRAYDLSITGPLSACGNMTSCTVLNLHNTDISVTDTALPAWAGCAIDLYDCEWTTAEVDDFLINMADGVGALGDIDIAGTNAARTQPDTDAAVAAIIAAGRALTVNE